jgi:hypothetical protein
MQEPSNGFVLRRRMSGAVIVGSYHDVLGPLFWELFRGANPAHYGLTTDVDRAHRFEPNESDTDAFLSSILECNKRLGRFGDFGALSKRVGISQAAFAEWVAAAVWLEIRAPATPLFLRRFEGRIERSSEWTRELSRAHRFSPSKVLLGGDSDSIRGHGRLVPVAAAWDEPLKQRVRMVRWVNHSLEADAAWAEWQLSLRFGLADVKARRHALKHAGMTGWQIAGSGCWERQRYFENSAELTQAFELGRALYCAVNLKWKNLRGKMNVSDRECARTSERLQAAGGFQTRAGSAVSK